MKLIVYKEEHYNKMNEKLREWRCGDYLKNYTSCRQLRKFKNLNWRDGW